jgi:hypothetical protein
VSMLLKPIVSCSGACPAPSCRATYHWNDTIYKIFRICQGVAATLMIFSQKGTPYIPIEVFEEF